MTDPATSKSCVPLDVLTHTSAPLEGTPAQRSYVVHDREALEPRVRARIE